MNCRRSNREREGERGRIRELVLTQDLSLRPILLYEIHANVSVIYLLINYILHDLMLYASEKVASCMERITVIFI